MGLPYLPVTEDDVAPAVERLRASLDGIRRLLFDGAARRVAGHDRQHLALDGAPGAPHAGADGAALARPRCRHATARRGGPQRSRRPRPGPGPRLRLDLRGGTGVEAFSARCGYERVGAWPRALKLPDVPDGGPDLRDEVLMWLPLR